jgi:hypothetical protein
MVAHRQSPLTSFTGQFHSTAGSLHDGIAVLTIKPMPPAVWRWCSAIEFVVFLLFVVIMNKAFRRLGVRKVQRGGGSRFMLNLFGAFGAASMLLQVYNLALPGAFWPFFAEIVYHLSLLWPSLPG